jgi:hypothetical protein
MKATTTLKYTILSRFQDDDQEEEKTCSSSLEKKDIIEPYPLKIYSKGVRKMNTNHFIASPPRQSSFDRKSPWPVQEIFPDEFNPFRCDAKLSVVANSEHREGSPKAIFTPTKAEADLLFSVPLTPQDSPTSVVKGPESHCIIKAESGTTTQDSKAEEPANDSPTSVVKGPGSHCIIKVESGTTTQDSKAEEPANDIVTTGGEEPKTDVDIAADDSQVTRLCIEELDAFNEEQFKRRKNPFMGYYCLSSCGQVLPSMNTDDLVDQVKSQRSKLNKGLEQVKTKGSKIGNRLATSLESLMNKTTSLCHNSGTVDDTVVLQQ